MEEYRDSKGRFTKDFNDNCLTIESRIKKLHNMEQAWKSRKEYIGDIRKSHPRIYNIWRGIRFTQKGKKIGNSKEWDSFRAFYQDVIGTYKEGHLFRRLDTSKSYSKDNFIWVSKEEVHLLKSNLVTIEYQGETLSLKQWADKLDRSLAGIKKRYYSDKSYTIKEILLGKTRKRGTKVPKDATTDLRIKASKMISSYRIKDRKNNLQETDIDIDWMIDNIITKPCIYCGDTHRIGCDRIYNNIGHLKSNVVPCCVECNTARNNYFSSEEMKIIGQAIKQVKLSRNN